MDTGAVQRVATLDEAPDLVARMQVVDATWPAFMRQARSVRRYSASVLSVFPELQVAVVEGHGDVVAKGHALPITWDGTVAGLPAGVEDVMKAGLVRRPVAPDTMCALAVVVRPSHRGMGLSRLVMSELMRRARRLGLRALLVPVRPSEKSRYPLVPMDRYARWSRSDGLPFDPWLRVHLRLGGQVLGVAERSMVVEGSVEDWEEWSGQSYPSSGRYLVEGALAPVEIDCEQDVGRYVEPNVWVHHRLRTRTGS